MKAYVGADWSGKEVVCVTACGDGPVRNIAAAEPSLSSVKELIERVAHRHPEATSIHVLIQAGEWGWVRLFDEAGAKVHVVDPRQSANFERSLCSSGAKDDRREARTLLEMGRSSAHCPPVWERSELEYVHQLGTALDQANRELQRALQQLRSLLRTTMPMVDRALGGVRAKSSWIFLRLCPTRGHFSTIDRASFEEGLRGSYMRSARRDAVWEAMQASLGSEENQVLREVEELRVRQLVDRIELLDTQVRTLEAKLDELTKELTSRKLLESVDGIGRNQACLLLEFAFGAKIEGRDTPGIRLGASPVFKGSGTRNGAPKGFAKMRRNVHYRARRGVYLLGRFAQQRLRWAAAMYEDGRRRGQSAATAYRRIARSLLRILTAILRDGVPYDDAKYVTALKSKGVPWAQAL